MKSRERDTFPGFSDVLRNKCILGLQDSQLPECMERKESEDEEG